MSYLSKIILAVITIFSFLFLPAKAATMPDVAKLLPPETVFVVEIPNCSQLKVQLEKTNFYKLYKDPAMAPLVKKIEETFEKSLSGENNALIKGIWNEKVLPQGKLALALVANQNILNSTNPPVLFLGQWGKNIDKTKELVEKQVSDSVNEGANKKIEDFRSVKIVTLITPQKPVKVPDYSNTNPDHNKPYPTKTITPEPITGHHCFIDDTLIVSSDLEALKFVIAHIKGATSPTLAADDDYAATMAVIRAGSDISIYINIKQIMKLFIADDQTGQVKIALGNFGLDNVASAGYSLALARQSNSSYKGRGLLKINGPKKGILKILDAKSSVLRAPKFLASDIYQAMFFNLDIKKAYDEIYSIANSFSPMYAAAMLAPVCPASPDGRPAIMLKNDIIDHMDSQVIITQSITKPFSKGINPVQYLFAVSVNNRGALEKSMSLLHSTFLASNDPDASRELLGCTIYTLDPAATPFFGSGVRPLQETLGTPSQQRKKLAFTITDSHLIMGLESTVEKCIRTLKNGSSATLGSAKWFNRTKSSIPPAGFIALENNATAMELLWWMMREYGKKKFTNLAPLANKLKFQDFMTPELLPEFKDIKKYFGSSQMHVISKPQGFYFEFSDLNPVAGD